MAELDAILEKFTDPITGRIHGATFVSVDSKGNTIYSKSSGYQKVDTKNSPALTPDTVTWIASMTKLTTSVAAMQIVERGLIGLDDDVRKVLPALKDMKVITGWNDEGQAEATDGEKPKGSPILEDIKGSITLRQLLSHSSGFCYDLWDPILVKYSAWADRKENLFSGTIEGNLHPLIFQPGTSWQYGPGLDWAGQIVEKLTGMGFDEYQQKYIWQPIGAKNTTFFPAKRGLTPDDIHELAFRAEGEGTQGLKAGPLPWKFINRDALGGVGLFTTANDYGKLLGALLADGGPLLNKASVDEMFRPQLGANSNAVMRKLITGTGPENTKSWLWAAEKWDDFMEIKHCLCGLVNCEDVKGRRRKNTVNWDGLPNLLWFIDRESGVAAAYFTQIMPFDDPPSKLICQELEEALYRIVNSS